MDIFLSKKMRYFISLAQTQNMSSAAEKMHITSSPFGKSIAALEAEVGHPLFHRGRGGATLTKYGQELYQKIFPVYQQLSCIDSELNHTDRHKMGIKIGIDDAYPTLIFDQLIALSDRFNDLSATSFEFSEASIIDNLLDRKFNFIISPQKASARIQCVDSLSTVALPPLRLFFLVSRKHDALTPNELLNQLPCLQMRFQNRANYEAIFNAHLRPHGINPTIVYRSYSFIAKISAVASGNFLTIIPWFAWRYINNGDFRIFEVPGSPIFMNEYLYSIKNHPQLTEILNYIASTRMEL